MRPRSIRLFLLWLILQMFLPTQIALADTGPKPTMDFQFKWESDLLPTSIASGTLYECHQPDCSDAAPLMEGGPQRFTCSTDNCHALAYGFAPYHKLEIQFSDGKTRTSNIFQTAVFASSYTVTIRPDDLIVEAQSSLGVLAPFFLLGMVCCCALVGMILLVGLIIFRRLKKT